MFADTFCPLLRNYMPSITYNFRIPHTLLTYANQIPSKGLETLARTSPLPRHLISPIYEHLPLSPFDGQGDLQRLLEPQLILISIRYVPCNVRAFFDIAFYTVTPLHVIPPLK